MSDTRLEHDLLGEREIPNEHYYGIQTLRDIENYNITGIPIAHYPRLVPSLTFIKKAAANWHARNWSLSREKDCVYAEAWKWRAFYEGSSMIGDFEGSPSGGWKK